MPSHAKIVRVNIPANPVIELDYTAVVGGTGGAPFQVSCNADEAVVGVYGNSAGTYVNRVGVHCIQIDQSGRWIGNPVESRLRRARRPGTAFTKTCARDFAISGYQRPRLAVRGSARLPVPRADALRARSPAPRSTSAPSAALAARRQGPIQLLDQQPGLHAHRVARASALDAFGMQCRQAPITQVDINTPPSLTNPGNQVTSVGAPVNLQVVATDADVPPDPLTFSATGLPPGLGISAGGLISGAPTTAGTYPVSISVSDGTVSTTANLTWTVTDLDPLILNPMPQQPPNVFGTPVTYTATRAERDQPAVQVVLRRRHRDRLVVVAECHAHLYAPVDLLGRRVAPRTTAGSSRARPSRSSCICR